MSSLHHTCLFTVFIRLPHGTHSCHSCFWSVSQPSCLVLGLGLLPYTVEGLMHLYREVFQLWFLLPHSWHPLHIYLVKTVRKSVAKWEETHSMTGNPQDSNSSRWPVPHIAIKSLWVFFFSFSFPMCIHSSFCSAPRIKIFWDK